MLNTRGSCWCALLATATVLASLLVTAAPAAAAPGGSPDSPDTTGTTVDETTSQDNDDENDDFPGDDLKAPVGPVANTGAAEYRTLWLPDELVPTDVTVVRADDSTELVVFASQSSLMAVVIIANAGAPTEYRFENAVPDGHTAAVHSDGSVRFFDTDGNEVAGILAPWAIDADAKAVPTHYTLDGTTLVQTVDHRGASYPVVADPLYVPIAVTICLASTTCGYVATSTYFLAPAVVTTAWNNRGIFTSGSGGSGGPPRPPTNSCNMRNHSGC